MKRFFQGVGAAALLVALLGFLQQRGAVPPAQAAPTIAQADQRFVIVGMDQALPLLLDTRTGRTWYRQIASRDSASGIPGGVVWTPVRITPADTSRFYFLPLASDVAR